MSLTVVFVATYLPLSVYLVTFGNCLGPTSFRHVRKQQLRATKSESQICIGDLCSPLGRTERFEAKESETFDLMLSAKIAPACPRFLAADARLMLMPVVPEFHGSTALEGVFMSSPEITTFCKYHTFGCEARFKISEASEKACTISYSSAACRQALRKDKDRFVQSNFLYEYTKHWDMKKPVLFEKGPRPTILSNFSRRLWNRRDRMVREYKEIKKESTHNDTLKKFGVNELKFAYLVMWRPICLSTLSGHSREKIEKDPKQYALEELNVLKNLIEAVEFLIREEVPMLVVSLADMMWRPKLSKWRLQEFLPCLGELDLNYVPQLGKDIFRDNYWKAEGSVLEFGKAVNASNLGYDVASGKCSGESNLFNLLEGEDFRDAMHAESFLWNLSPWTA